MASLLALEMVVSDSVYLVAVALLSSEASGPNSIIDTATTTATMKTSQDSEWISLRVPTFFTVFLLTPIVNANASTSTTPIAISCGAMDATTFHTSLQLMLSIVLLLIDNRDMWGRYRIPASHRGHPVLPLHRVSAGNASASSPLGRRDGTSSCR